VGPRSTRRDGAGVAGYHGAPAVHVRHDQ